jgi:hypothetical protein
MHLKENLFNYIRSKTFAKRLSIIGVFLEQFSIYKIDTCLNQLVSKRKIRKVTHDNILYFYFYRKEKNFELFSSHDDFDDEIFILEL